MIRGITLVLSTTAFVAAALALPAGVMAASAKSCVAQYKAGGEALGNRATFLKRCIGGRQKPEDPKAPPKDATTLACAEEYENNKAAIDGDKQTRAGFIKDCKNGTEKVPGGIKSPPPPEETSAPPASAPTTFEPRPDRPGTKPPAAAAPAASPAAKPK